jgi:NTP pyrophosphatase (non-canonical NTP hydrolase)
MNARIQQLMDRSFTDHQGERFDPERFAQLLVAECAGLMDHVIMEDGTRRGDFIRKHFGVTE